MYTSDGKEVYVDDEDYDYLNKFNWSYNGRYAVSNINKNTINMHRLIIKINNINIPKGYIVDHIDGDGLNNTKLNLRVCTQSNNQMNKAKTKSKTTSKYKGVYFDKHNKKWNATIEHSIDGNRKKINLGLFDDEELSARVYDVNAITLFGEYARTNFPLEDYINNSMYDEFIRINRESKKSSRFKYVSWAKNINKWAVELNHNKTKYRLGYYDDEVEAAKVANKFIIDNSLNKKLNEV